MPSAFGDQGWHVKGGSHTVASIDDPRGKGYHCGESPAFHADIAASPKENSSKVSAATGSSSVNMAGITGEYDQ